MHKKINLQETQLSRKSELEQMMEFKKMDWVLYIQLVIKKVFEKKKNSELILIYFMVVLFLAE